MIDLFPTLNEFCSLPAITDLEGASILPLLKNPDTNWERPAITSLVPDSYSIRAVKWRFILYGDGSIELYDRVNDLKEWINLAYDNSRNQVISELKEHIPTYSKPMPKDSFDSGTLTLYK